MTKFQNKYRIESIRLKGWDYSIPWWYFVTINTKDHKKYFGKIISGKIKLNDFGKIVEREWLKSKQIRKNIDLDYFVIMPNHIHGIIIINKCSDSKYNDHREFQQDVSTIADSCKNINTAENKNIFFSKISPKSNSLSVIIRGFKASVTKFAHENGIFEFQWQSRFYDRIIRNENELYNIRKYIEQNPLIWEMDI